jgi:DNA polymerase-4
MDNLFPFLRASQSRYLFVDMNAFFASVEQQEVTAYRNQPVIVVPVLVDTTCAIAASYEAKACGIKTGTSVQEARRLCPPVRVVEARPELYLNYHARIVEILRAQFPTVKILSVDEMACRMSPYYKTIEAETRVAQTLKQNLAAELGDHMRCSVGIAPNVFLSKTASERMKPNGLTIWDDQNLPDALFSCRLIDLPGIGRGIERRLKATGIETVERLWEASESDLRRAWGSVVGARWYYMLRGSQECDYAGMVPEGQPRKSAGHSHVLPPEHRTLAGAKRILLELAGRALKRLRAYNQLTSAVQITIKYRAGKNTVRPQESSVWTRRSRKHLPANDETTWFNILRPLLTDAPDKAPFASPSFVSVTFSDLLDHRDRNLSLFDDIEEKVELAKVVDGLNRRFGNKVWIGALGQKERVPRRIAFGAPNRD